MRKILGLWLFLVSSLLYAEEKEATKIVYFTVPKGGSQLCKKVIGLITERPMRKLFPLQETSFLSSYIGYNHLGPGYEDILEDRSGAFIKVIMIRDPRDVIISMAAWIQVMADTEAAKEFAKLSLDEQIEELIVSPNLSMNGRYPFVFDTYLAIEYALKWMADPAVHICLFEDLVGAKGGGAHRRQIEAINDLARHLHCDLSSEQVAEIAEGLFGDTVTFRTGQIGSWKEVFTPRHKELFKAKMGKELIELGYEKDDTW